MLSWMCCNLCTLFSDENGASPFYVTTCKHIACNKCVSKGKMSPVCGVCKQSAQVKRIDELTGDAKLLFEDPRVAMKKYMEEGIQAVKFQQQTQLFLVNGLEADKRKLEKKNELLAASAMNTTSGSANTAAASASRPAPRSSLLAEPIKQSLRENVTSSRHASSATETPRNLNTSRGSYVNETPVAAGSSGASASKSSAWRDAYIYKTAAAPGSSGASASKSSTPRDAYIYKTPTAAGSSGASASKSTTSLQMIRNAGKKNVFDVVPVSSATSVRSDFGEREKRQLRDPIQARGSRSVALPPRHSPYGNDAERKQTKSRFV